MTAPLPSTVAVFTEIAVAGAIIFVIYSGYVRNRFPYALAAAVTAFETVFNVGYMVWRIAAGGREAGLSRTILLLGMAHGIFSLVMLIGLLVFMGLAWANYRKGNNFFRRHGTFTFVFVGLWLAAVASGLLVYVAEYL